jgi:hypothetical protein
MFYPVFQIWRIIVSIKAIELLDITLLAIEILHVYSTVMYIMKYSIIHEENTKEIFHYRVGGFKCDKKSCSSYTR